MRMETRTDQFSGTMPVRESHRFDVASLERYMQGHVEGFSGALEVSQFRGGQSNPTFHLAAGGKEYVLRRKPPGKLLPSAHAVDREYRVITALRSSDVPVARSYALCTDDSVIGTAFYIMDYVKGRIFWESTLPDLLPADRAAIYDAMNQVLASLHKVDYAALGLGDYGKPGSYVARQIDRWTKQYRASETERIDAMDRLIAWLPAHVPSDEATSIVHGDYRLDNMIFHPTEPRILAVLDWELSTLGHPLSDLSYHCMLWRLHPSTMKGMQGLDIASLGIPSEADYIAAYCRRTGRAHIDHWDFYMAYSMFRLAAIHQGILGRVKQGTASNAHAVELGAMAKPIAEQGWREVERIGG
jgi:aminoglycoside phosphotransferase (APT) family kinase protein